MFMRHLMTVFFFVTILCGCNSLTDKDTTKDADFIFGKWQNNTEKNSFLELLKTGEYIVWINDETLEKNPVKFKYDPTKQKDNFELTENGESIQKGTIEIIDKDRIKLSIYAFNSNEVFSSSEYIRINENK